MTSQGRVNSEFLANLLPIFLGLLLAISGTIRGSSRNLLVGVALACTGIVGLLAPRLLPPAPGLGPEQARARRVSVIFIPNGIIYLLLGILLFTALPASQRGGVTPLIGIVAIGIGILSILSGLGARVRARRPDDPPLPGATASPNDEREAE